MKLALVTDLHANREAVEAVLDHARTLGVGQYVLLGDFVGYGADPGWVIDLVRTHMARGALAVIMLRFTPLVSSSPLPSFG